MGHPNNTVCRPRTQLPLGAGNPLASFHLGTLASSDCQAVRGLTRGLSQFYAETLVPCAARSVQQRCVPAFQRSPTRRRLTRRLPQFLTRLAAPPESRFPHHLPARRRRRSRSRRRGVILQRPRSPSRARPHLGACPAASRQSSARHGLCERDQCHFSFPRAGLADPSCAPSGRSRRSRRRKRRSSAGR